MPKVVRARSVEFNGVGDRRVNAFAPVPPVVIGPRPTLTARKDKRAPVGPAARKTPLGNVGRQGREKPDTLLPLERERLTRPKSGVGEDADQGRMDRADEALGVGVCLRGADRQEFAPSASTGCFSSATSSQLPDRRGRVVFVPREELKRRLD